MGPWMDRCFLDLPPPQATRNRRDVLKQEIQTTLEQVKDEQRPARITSLACGPAREVIDVFELLDNPAKMAATLIDLDMQALDFVKSQCEERGLTQHVRLLNENLMYLAARESKIDLEPQDLIYSIGLIDYFGDQFVISLINFVYDYLRPGGRIILGNFHPRNPGKALMDYIIEWRLIHRDEKEMDQLFLQSKFAKPCSRVVYEKQQINLFAECVK